MTPLLLARAALRKVAALAARVLTLESRDTFVVVTADQTLIGTGYTDVAGLGVAVAANADYEFEFTVIADADAATTGIDIAVNGPASPTSIVYNQHHPRATTSLSFRVTDAYDTNTANTGSGGTTPCLYRVEGVLRNGANAGTLIPRIKREAVGTGPNVRIGSWGRVRRIA